jgi:hypothetical protein
MNQGSKTWPDWIERLIAPQRHHSDAWIRDLKEGAARAEQPGIRTSRRTLPVVVSLTSFGGRIDWVHLVIESLFRQTVLADEIVLWLADHEFEGRPLPSSLSRLEDRGLTIRFTKDIGPYKKLIPQLRYDDQTIIVTVDDDVLMPPTTLEHLLEAHVLEPNLVHCNRAHRISFDRQGRVRPYVKWASQISDRTASHLVFPTGVGGVLYPPGSLHKEITNEAAFQRLAPTNDDIWFKAMAILAGTPARKTCAGRAFKDHRFTFTPESQIKSLAVYNRHGGGNDQWIADVFDHYEIWGKLV